MRIGIKSNLALIRVQDYKQSIKHLIISMRENKVLPRPWYKRFFSKKHTNPGNSQNLVDLYDQYLWLDTISTSFIYLIPEDFTVVSGEILEFPLAILPGIEGCIVENNIIVEGCDER